MFDFFRPTHPFGGQTLRLVAESQQGGGDVFDIARTCYRIEEGDKAGWEREWLATAEATEAKAKAALAAGRTHTARKFFFHANQYWRMSDVFLVAPELDKKAQRFRKAQENFRQAAALCDPPIEVITVSCGAEEYEGYFCHPVNPKPGKWPVVLMHGGADAFAEEIYFSGRQILERGWALLLVDTPGRGSSSYIKRIPTRADYEVPTSACIDWLEARPEIDKDRIALLGISMAGYYAPRAAAFEKRIKALIGWCGCYSLLDDLYIFCEHLRPTVQRLLGGVDDATARDMLKDFTMDGIAGNITCPTLIFHGTNDTLMDVEGAKRLFAEIGAADKTLQLYDDPEAGGAIHCSHDRWVDAVPLFLDWLEDRL